MKLIIFIIIRVLHLGIVELNYEFGLHNIGRIKNDSKDFVILVKKKLIDQEKGAKTPKTQTQY